MLARSEEERREAVTIVKTRLEDRARIQALQTFVQNLSRGQAELRQENKELRQENKELRQESKELKQELDELRATMWTLFNINPKTEK